MRSIKKIMGVAWAPVSIVLTGAGYAAPNALGKLRIKKQNVAAMGICMLLPATALAEYPFSTDDTGVQGVGGSKLELSGEYSRSKEGGMVARERAAVVTYTRGLTDVLDAQISVPWQSLSEAGGSTNTGWGNVSVGMTWLFYNNEESKLSFALKPTVVLPVSSRGEAKDLGNGRTSYGLRLAASKEMSFGELNFNLDAERTNFDSKTIRDETRLNTYRMSVSPIWNASEALSIGFDFGIQTNPDKTKKSAMGYVGMAVAYMFTDNLRGGFGITRDVSDGSAETTSGTVGLVWYFH